MADDEDVLTVEEAAVVLGVSEATVRRAFDAGELNGYRTRPGGGWRRIYRTSVDEYRRLLRGDRTEPPSTNV